MVIEKWLSITMSFPTYTWENTGKETFVFGSTKLVANTEDFKPEELKLQPSHQDLLIDSDHLSDVKPSDITTDPEPEKVLLLLKSDQLVLEFNSLNQLELLSIIEERTEVKKVLMSTKLVWLTISANSSFILNMKESMLLKLKEVSSMTLLKYFYFYLVSSNCCYCSSCQHFSSSR